MLEKGNLILESIYSIINLVIGGKGKKFIN